MLCLPSVCTSEERSYRAVLESRNWVISHRKDCISLMTYDRKCWWSVMTDRHQSSAIGGPCWSGLQHLSWKVQPYGPLHAPQIRELGSPLSRSLFRFISVKPISPCRNRCPKEQHLSNVLTVVWNFHSTQCPTRAINFRFEEIFCELSQPKRSLRRW